MRHREPAICLKTTDYSETSQVLHFLTRGQGVVHVLGKGTKRPKSKSGGAIDLLNEGEVVFSARNPDVLGTLIEFTETESRPGLRRDSSRLYAALYAVEMACEMLALGDPHPPVFDLLHNALTRLSQDGAPAQAVLAFYQWRFLRHVGLMGDLTRCVVCGGPIRGPGVTFSSRLGGLVCPPCQASAPEKLPVEAEALEGLQALAAAAGGAKVPLPEPQARGVNRMLSYHTQQQLGRAMRTRRCALG